MKGLLETPLAHSMHRLTPSRLIENGNLQRSVVVSLMITAMVISGCHKSARAARPNAPVNANRATSAQTVSSKPASGGSSGTKSQSSRSEVAKPDAIKAGYTETGIASWYGVPYHGRRSASGEVFDMEQLTAAHKTLPFQTWVEVTNLDNGEVIVVRINDRGPFIDGRIIDLSQRGARDIGMLRAGLAKVRLRVMEASELEAIKLETSKLDASKLNSNKADLSKPDPSTFDPSLSDTSLPAPVLKTRAPITSDRTTVSAESPKAAASAPVTRTAPRNTPAAPSSYTVQAGTFADRAAAEAVAKIMAARFGDARVLLSPAAPVEVWRVVVGRSLSLGEAGQIFLSIRSDVGNADVVPEPEAVRPN